MAAAEERVDSKFDEFCHICATVTIGLERVCALECERKLTCKVHLGRGRIYFEIPRTELGKIKDLRSVENLFVVVSDIACFKSSADESVEETLERFYHLPEELNWESAIRIWKEFNEFSSDSTVKNFLPILNLKSHTTGVAKQEIESANPIGRPDEERSDPIGSVESHNLSVEQTKAGIVLPRFRVTCTRTHSVPSQKHPFTSMQAAAKFGGAINDQFGWIVDLENFDLEVLLNIVDSHVVVGISLTKESLFRRNIVNFGPTTLRSTLAYCLALLADIKKGEISSGLKFKKILVALPSLLPVPMN
jgi:23S rRNA G2445 N2-methylase RlmL